MFRQKLERRRIERTLKSYRGTPLYREIYELKSQISMLHEDVLMLLYHFAKTSRCAILEIGPYIGGSTIALAKGLQASGSRRPLVTIEKGGAHNHPTLPSSDILSDLRKNLHDFHVEDMAHIIEGISLDPTVLQELKEVLGTFKVDLFVLDANGTVAGEFFHMTQHLVDDCLVVIDDYVAPCNEKEALAQNAVDFLVEGEYLEPFGVYGWGTWLGRRTGKALPGEITELRFH
jgi:predicted O-methyltransferase YrrM